MGGLHQVGVPIRAGGSPATGRGSNQFVTKEDLREHAKRLDQLEKDVRGLRGFAKPAREHDAYVLLGPTRMTPTTASASQPAIPPRMIQLTSAPMNIAYAFLNKIDGARTPMDVAPI